MVVILMGVAGAGKTTIGRALAADLGARFIEGDDIHAPAAVAKMRAGVPLTDADRAPWLASLHAIVAAALDRREPLILSCSALKERYRQVLRGNLRTVRFVYLKADPETLARRLADRRGHLAGPALLASQLADLETPADALTIDGTKPPDQIVDTIRREFGL
jgi:gluconokinase